MRPVRRVELNLGLDQVILTTVVSLVLIAHVPAVVVSIADPGRGDAPSVIAAELVGVAGPHHGGCRDETHGSEPRIKKQQKSHLPEGHVSLGS